METKQANTSRNIALYTKKHTVSNNLRKEMM